MNYLYTYKGGVIAIITKKWFGLRVKVDFVLNHNPFWVWCWEIKNELKDRK